MSRSFKKHPITGNTTKESDRPGKRRAHKARRAAERTRDDHVDIREVSDVWSFPKDGKQYWKKNRDKARRK